VSASLSTAAIVDQMNASLPRWFQLFIGVAEIWRLWV
jgi:hypothetical protein